MKKLNGSRILFGVGIAILICYVGLLVYFYNFYEYSPYASAGADVDALIHSVTWLPPMIVCLVLSFVLRMDMLIAE